MEEVKIRELSEKSSINTTDHLVIEDQDGTKKVSVKHFRSLVLSTLYFNTIKELKESSTIGLKEGDICETLGYHTPGDGGSARYKITYNPSAVEDGRLVHYLAYSDTLRAEIVLDDVINVHQFGAIGDGITDDSDAIQAAIENSGSKIVEFSNNKKYCISNTIIINKPNTIINGNGAILYPLYVDGMNITKCEDVTINKMNIDCSRATSGINVFNASKVHITGCTFTGISETGIALKNCSFITISGCQLTGQATTYLITLNGEAIGNETPTCKFIDIEDTKFNNFSRAVDIQSTGSDSNAVVLNINNCRYDSTVSNSCCIYASCVMELLSINTNTVTASTAFLYTGGVSGGTISCKDISCLNTPKIFDIGSTACILRLDGAINTSPNAVMFESMAGKLYSNVMWETLGKGASFTNKPIGEINDVVNPYNYSDTKGYTVTGSRLTLHEARNMHINWSSSTNNLNEIVNGIKGQLIYVRSLTNRSIVAVADKILLSDSAIRLGRYYGVLLKYDGLKWIQISNLTPISAINNNMVNSPNNSLADTILSQVKDTNTTYTLFKDGNNIILADSDGNQNSVVDDDTHYTLEDFGIEATPDEINRLSGMTITKDELNILDGLISSTEELNFLVGATGNIQAQLDSKAPTAHASTDKKYGIGTSQEYGHVALSDNYIDAVGGAADGIAASQAALRGAYTVIQSQIGDTNTAIADIKSGEIPAAEATKLQTARTIRINLASTAEASFDGSANVTPGVIGILPVTNGGTGRNTFAAGQLLVGNGNGAINTRAITDNTNTAGAITANTNIPTMNTLKNALNRTTSVAANDTNYSTVMVRGIAAGTGNPPENLPNGAIWLKYT